MNATLSVSNMHCEACARRVTKAIQKAEPEAVPQVDLASGKVKVSASTNLEAIVAALQEAGYPAKVDA